MHYLKNKKILLAVLVLVILGAFFFSFKNTNSSDPVIVIDGKSLPIELADTDEERVLGLGGRSEIGSNGLLFLFDKEDEYGIWMKSMQFSIDIMWLDSDFNVVYLEKNVSPNTFPNVFYPPVAVKYVFEADAGFIDKFKIEEGTKLNFDY